MKKNIAIALVSLSINIAIACLAIFVFGTKLLINDDSSISWMTYGINTVASSRTLYTHCVLGWIYKHLFSFISGFNWQTLAFYLGIILSGTVALYVVIRKNTLLLLCFWLLFEIVVFYNVYVCVTFSVVSAYIACQGYMSLFLIIKENEKSLLLYMATGLTILLSSMIRLDSFLGISGFALFAWLILVIKDYRETNNIDTVWKKYMYPFVIIIGVVFLVASVDKLMYTKGDWKNFKEYEAARLIFTDNRNSINDMDLEELQLYDINNSKRIALIEWRDNDPDQFNVESIKMLAKSATKCNRITNHIIWKEYLMALRMVFLEMFESYFALLLFIFVIFSVWRKELWFSVLILIPFFSELFYFSFIGRTDEGHIPERCVYIILMGLIMGDIIIYDALNREKRIVPRFLWPLVIVSAFAVLPIKDYSINGLGLVNMDELNKKYGFLGNNDKVYVCDVWVMDEICQQYGAWQVPQNGFMDHCISLGGWTVKHPMMNELQNSLECKNPYRALYEKDNVFYIRKVSSEEEVLEYIHENYDDRITMEYIKEKAGFKVFKYRLE